MIHLAKPSLMTGGTAVDDRGTVRFVNDFDFDGVKRFYQVANHTEGFIRAWHGHWKEGKYVFVPRGTALVGAVQMEERGYVDGVGEDCLLHAGGAPERYVLSSDVPKVLWIPPGHANGFMNLEADTVVQFFSTTTLEQSLGDDIRFPHDQWDIWDIEQR
jgi:dTDP-4-dehydrorhamnose 3,5-epimerase